MRVVVVVKAFADAESHHVVEGIGESDRAGTEVDVYAAALSQPVVVFAPSASLGWGSGVGVVVCGQLSLPSLGSTSGYLVGGRLSGSWLLGTTTGGGGAGLGVVL